jgi:hypothetical protein
MPDERIPQGLRKPTHRKSLEAKGSMPDFALDKWGYSLDDLGKFITTVSKGDPAVRESLETALREGGGKAFGLKICELVAKNFTHPPYKILIPPWHIVPDVRNVDPFQNRGRVLRSSDFKEDWLDPNSGTLRSYNFDSFNETILFGAVKSGRFTDSKLPEVPHILQEAREGYGWVLDIAHSELLGESVVKIASGNSRGDLTLHGTERYTSATDDFEASVGVWEAETGQPVLPERNFHKSFFETGQSATNTFAPALVRALQKTGIDFGVQMEMIVNPDNPNDIHLVQIRPSPSRLSRKITIDGGAPEKIGELISTGSIVNGRFDYTGTRELLLVRLGDFRGEGKDVMPKIESIEQAVSRKKAELQRLKIVKGEGVGIYEGRFSKRGESEFGLNYNQAFDIYLGAYIHGKVVQITPSAIRPNVHHDKMEYALGSSLKYDYLDNHCGMVSLPESEIAKLMEATRDGKNKLRVVSDGLITRIYLIKQ